MPISSLYFHALLYYSSIYTIPLIVFELFLFILKYNSLAYTTSTIAGEVIILIIVFFVNLGRLTLGFHANKGKSVGKFIGYFIMTAIVLLSFIYVIVWQRFIYWLEFICFIIALVLVGI